MLLVLAPDLQAQTISQGQILVGNGSALVPISPFTCYVDGVVYMTIKACVTYLTSLPPGVGGNQGGVITTNTPEVITQLPWDPATFSGTIRFGVGNNSTTCDDSNVNCWVMDVPLITGSGMQLVGSGYVQNGANFSNGTAITWGGSGTGNFPAALGAPSYSAASLSCGGTGTLTDFYLEVNELNTYPGSALKVPGFSAPSAVVHKSINVNFKSGVTPSVADQACTPQTGSSDGNGVAHENGTSVCGNGTGIGVVWGGTASGSALVLIRPY